MRNAIITEKQCIYIVNCVILSRVAYRIQNTKLSHNLCEDITNQYTQITKNKAHISKSAPSSTFWHNRIYGLKKVADIQLQQHIAIIMRLLNHLAFNKSAFKLILQQLQNKADNGTSILSQDPGVYAGNYDTCRIVEIIRSCHEYGITFTRNILTEWPRLNMLEGDSINQLIKGINQAAKIKQRLMQLGINTIQQIMNEKANVGLEWSKIAQNIKKIPRGKEPWWYKVIQVRCRSWLMKVVKSERKQNTAMVYKLEYQEKNWCLMTDGTIG